MRPYIATGPLAGRLHGRPASGNVIDRVLIGYSYSQSGSSGCFRSHSGRRLWTSGMVAKLYAGGGEVVDHSSVHASHGSLPAAAPRRYDHSRLATNTSTAAA